MRYAYWRNEKGELQGQGNHNCAPVALLAEIGNSAKVNAAKEISWSSFDFMEYETAAFSSIAIKAPDGSELNEDDTSAIARSAAYALIRESGGETPILPGELLDSVNELASTFFKTAPLPYTFVSSLSVKDCPLLPIHFSGFEVRSTKREDFPYPKALLRNRSFLTSHLSGSQYLPVAIKVNARSKVDAFSKAIAVLNAVRGMLSLITTFKDRQYGFSSIPRREWIGVLHLGPIHTLHQEGDSSDPTYWYEPEYVADVPLFKPSRGWEPVCERFAWLLNQLASLEYRDVLVLLFARYAIALDQLNRDVAFLMLWSLLEKMTDTIGARYDKTVDRVAWVYKDREAFRQILNHIRFRRNRFVHSAASTGDINELCYTTKSFVDEHLAILARNELSVSSLQEYGEFLSLPQDPKRIAQLERQLRIVRWFTHQNHNDELIHGLGI